MKTDDGIRTARDEHVVDALDAYLAARHAGRPIAKADFLARHPELAQDLERYLANLELVTESDDDKPDGIIGGTLGDFRIRREIGRGGMGVVYEAEQISLGRRVALKVLPFAAVFDDRQLQRFKNEAQAAAHLHHTNIVPVHAVGCERGVHYYAMQFIEGRSFAQILEELRGSTKQSSVELSALTKDRSNRSVSYCRAVTRLAIQAAEALDHAHQSGVVHRDIKPANLILDGRAHVWITDFGLASFERNTGVTMTGDLIGTVRYMSPEQAMAKRIPIDHRTDIYSLGATLYELLTLKPAHPGDDPHTVMRAIAFEEPRPARTRNPAIPPELETILLKAMAKDPHSRYATALDFADDLRRFLEHKPIQAKRPSLVARGFKWAHRHRVIVAAACIVLAISTIVLGISTYRVGKALDRAEDNLLVAREAVDSFLVEIGIDNLPERPMPTGSRRRLLEQALEFYDRHLQGAPDAQALHTRGLILHDLHRYDEALAAYEQALEQRPDEIVFILKRAHMLRHAGHAAMAQAEIARALRIAPGNSDAHSEQGRLLLATGRPEEALAAFERGGHHSNRGVALFRLGRFDEALAACDEALKLEPNSAHAHTHRGLALDGLGRLEEALAAQDRAVGIDPDDAASHHNRGLALGRLGRLEEAVAACDRALELDPLDATTHSNRGGMLRRMGRLEEALAACDRALELDSNYASAYSKRGEVLCELGRFEEAFASFDNALSLDPNDADIHCRRGTVLAGKQRFEEALASFERAVELDPKYVVAQHNRGIVLRKLGRLEEALVAHDRALELDPDRAATHLGRSEALRKLGRFGEALAACDRALALDPEDVSAHADRAADLMSLGRAEEALAAVDRALELDPNHANARNTRGFVLAELDRIEEALTEYDRALELDPSDGSAAGNRALAFTRLGRLDEALVAYDRALKLNPDHVNNHNNRGCLASRLGRIEEALASYDRAVALDPKFAFAHANRGIALTKLRRFDEALAALDRALELAPDLAGVHVDRGHVLSMLGRDKDALACCDRALELDPNHVRAHTNRGVVLVRLGRRAEGLTAYDRALELDPKDVLAHANRGSVLANSGRPAEALVAFERALAMDPKDSFVHANRAFVLSNLDRFAEAIDAYERAYELGLRTPVFMSYFAWDLATVPDPKLRDAPRAVKLARFAVGAAPKKPDHWNSLGAALYYTGEYRECIAALQKYEELGGDDVDGWFFIAMAKHKLGEKDAREWYDKAVAWMEKNDPDDDDLKRFRAEAAEALGTVK